MFFPMFFLVVHRLLDPWTQWKPCAPAVTSPPAGGPPKESILRGRIYGIYGKSAKIYGEIHGNGGEYNIYISGWWFWVSTPLKNDGVKVSWDDAIPNIWKNKDVPKHQPDIYIYEDIEPPKNWIGKAWKVVFLCRKDHESVILETLSYRIWGLIHSAKG